MATTPSARSGRGTHTISSISLARWAARVLAALGAVAGVLGALSALSEIFSPPARGYPPFRWDAPFGTYQHPSVLGLVETGVSAGLYITSVVLVWRWERAAIGLYLVFAALALVSWSGLTLPDAPAFPLYSGTAVIPVPLINPGTGTGDGRPAPRGTLARAAGRPSVACRARRVTTARRRADGRQRSVE